MNTRKLLRYALLAIISIYSSTIALAQVNADQVMAIGRNVMAMDDYILAIQYFNQAIKAKPYLSDPYFFRALAKLQLEDYKGTEEDCTRAIELNKFKTEAYKLRGYARQYLGKNKQAIEDFNIGLEYYPTDKSFLYYKGVAQMECNDYQGADSTFSILLKAYPRFEDGHCARARLNLLKGDTIAALTDISKTLELSKNVANAYLMRADIEANAGNWENALNDMNDAIRLYPQEDDLYVNRAFIRYNADDYFGAMSDYNYALELNSSNKAARFNRALLRYEVKDLEHSAEDFTTVLKSDPDNVHALYNRGLVYLEMNRNNNAIADFNAVIKKYPKFYPVYYALAEAQQKSGNMRLAMQNAAHAEDLVRKYVSNPEKNPLDRPTIAAGKSNSSGTDSNAEESENDVMDRFNQLVTVAETAETKLSYNDKIKGKLQDRDVRVELEPMYQLTYYDTPSELHSVSNYFRELDDINRQHILISQLYLTNDTKWTSDNDIISNIFKSVEEYSLRISDEGPQPLDLLGRGVAYSMLKNYSAAVEDFSKAIEISPKFTSAYIGRAYAAYELSGLHALESDDSHTTGDDMLRHKNRISELTSVIHDLDTALELNPRLVYAWFNKGNIFYELTDYTSALQCYTEAIKTNPDFGEAYYNRGIVYLRMGNKQQAFSDLSKAGELGVLPSYNLLKRMK